MLSSAEFIDFILKGGGGQAPPAETQASAALPEGFEGFDAGAEHLATGAGGATSFARRLLEAAGFGLAQLVERNSVIRSTDAVAKYLPERASYWPKTATRPYQTLLFEAAMTSGELLKIPAFRNTELRHLDDVEAALARLVSEALDGFQKGGEGVTADVRKGRREETLCIVSIVDQREGQSVRLVCFGTRNKQSEGLETFQITEQTRFWDPQLARDHLGLLYERQFKKLAGADWQDAFTTTDERKQAERLLDICTRKPPKEHDIQEGVLDLLDIIAKGFGLRRKPNTERRLQAFELPSDHDIGIDPEDREGSFGSENPFGGVTLRDERSRLLGYIVYPLNNKSDASRLRKHLSENNRFHNVLVVYPDEDQTSLELWQGREQLTGKLRKGQGYKDAADVVNLLSRFFVVSKAKVRNPTELAQELAYRARYLRRLAVKQIEEEKDKGPLRNLYSAFKEALVHDQTEDEFADAFAQTITYGLLTARWVGGERLVADGERLTRKTAMKYLPAASPFLNRFFASALSVHLDEQRGRLLWLVDDIADLLDRVDVTFVFGVGDKNSDLATDPVIHFYEPFLAAYNKVLKSKRGVFYTPRPVVSYIVRSVHELLQSEFGLADGLADTTTWGEMLKRHPGLKLPPLTDEPGEKRTISPDEHFVQILDPATGTATFLVEVIDVIHRTLAAKWKQQRLTDAQQRAAWNDYVPRHLLPRLHAFELMMAPYAIAHMKIGLKLAETGYRFGTEERARIYLTNALEPWVKQLPLIGFDALAHEAAAVNEIKRHKRFTVVIGNPPYSKLSSNLTAPVRALIEPYKYFDGARIRERGALQFEMNLQDDYIKFVRLSEVTIQIANTGVTGLICNRGFLDNPTLRGMRWSLSTTYSSISVLDLRGHQSTMEDGNPDENVFDIKQGVAIAVTTRPLAQAKVPSQVKFTAFVGPRDKKYRILSELSVSTIEQEQLHPRPPLLKFVPTDSDLNHEFAAMVSLTELFPRNGAGFISSRDGLVVGENKSQLEQTIIAFGKDTDSESAIYERYGFGPSKRLELKTAQRAVRQDDNVAGNIRPCLYRPFDQRWVYYKRELIESFKPIAFNFSVRGNIALLATRQVTRSAYEHALVSRCMGEIKVCSHDRNTQIFPLFLRSSEDELAFSSGATPNLDPAFLAKLAKALGLKLNATSRDLGKDDELSPLRLFHFTYSVLHCPSYRERYFEFLRSDFPRLPLTGNLELFRELARLGGELTALHLLESPRLAQPLTEFIGGRNPEVEKVSWSRDTVWVDKAQTTGFRGVREPVWNFHIGGYQVCEKWLKDRKGRSLTKDDIALYQKIVVALSETIRVMREVDLVIEKHGGWPSAFATRPSGDIK